MSVAEFLLNNPLADLGGLTFCVVHLCLIAALLIIGRLGLRSLDETAALPQIPTPVHPDPYEVAYLHGGDRLVTQTVTFNLIEQGYLQLSQDHQPLIRQATNPPALQRLLPLERTIFTYFASPAPVAEIAQKRSLLDQIKIYFDEAVTPPPRRATTRSLRNQIKPYYDGYNQILHKKEMLASMAMKGRAWGNILSLASIIVVFGAYKGYVAVERANVSLFLIALLSLIGIALVIYWCRLPRLSERGRIYLKQLQQAFKDLKSRPDLIPSAQPQSDLTLAMGLFGPKALAGTNYDSFQAALTHTRTTSNMSWNTLRVWERWVRNFWK